jgi:hypothetical protein
MLNMILRVSFIKRRPVVVTRSSDLHFEVRNGYLNMIFEFDIQRTVHCDILIIKENEMHYLSSLFR